MTIDSIISTLAKEGAKKKFPSPVTIVWRWTGLFFIYAVGAIFYFPLRPDLLLKLHHPQFLIELSSIILLIILSLLSASYLALPDSNQKNWARFLPFFPLAILSIILAVALVTQGSSAWTGCLDDGQFACAKAVLLFSILPGAALFYTIQKAAPLHCYWAGTMAGLAGSGMGYLLLLLVEPHDNPAHLLIWHFLPILITMIIAMGIGKKILGHWQR